LNAEGYPREVIERVSYRNAEATFAAKEGEE